MALDALAKMIPVEGEPMLLEIVQRIERCRALQEDESRLVEVLIRKERRRSNIRVQHTWTRDDDRKLLRIKRDRRAQARFAAERGLSSEAVRTRLRRLRNQTNGKPREKR